MIMRFNFSAALAFVLASNFLFVAVAKSEDSVQDSEREFAESLFPILKTIREFSEKIDENVAKFRRLSDGKSRKSRSNVPADPATKELDQLPDVPIEKSREQLQKDLLNELTYAHRRQNELVRDMELKLRVYVSTSVDKCKRHIAAGDEIGARASCAIAQEKISQCSRKVEPEINQRADRLNAEYKSIYRDMDNISVSFSKIHCNLVFNGIEDPGKLLRAANLQLPDTSCYAHTEEVKNFAKTGVMQNRLGKDDASVPAYLSYIQRKCPERISSEARLAVEEILRAKAEEGRKLKENEEQTPLTRDGSRSGSGMFKQAIGQAEQEEKDRPAREARERAAQARAAEQEWIEKQKAIAAARAYEQEQARKSEQNARETREALGQLIGALGQYQQNSVDRKQAAAPLAARGSPVKKLEMVNEVDATQWQCNDKWKSLYRITITPTSLRIPRLTSSEQDTILEKQADGSFLHQDRPGSQAFKTIIRFQGAEKLNMAFTNLEGVINLTYDCTRMAPTGSAER